MTGNYKDITETFDKEHRHLGGIVYSSDFNTEFRNDNTKSGSIIAQLIEYDFRREKKLYEQRKENW